MYPFIYNGMRLKILNDPKILSNFHKKMEKYLVKKPNIECWTWSSNCESSSGYPLQSIGGRKGYTERVSRIMLYLNSPIEENLYALHTCDNPKCVNPSHLYWGTAKDNTMDMIQRGRNVAPPVLTRDKTSRCYIKTTADIQKLRDWCEYLSIQEIANKLNKSYKATSILLSRLGLKSKINLRGLVCKPPYRPSKFEEPNMEKELILLSTTHTVSELSRHFNVKRDTIYRQLNRLKLQAVNSRTKK